MSYIEQTLMAGETVQYRTQLHWIIFSRPLIYLFLAGCAFLFDLRLFSFLLLLATVATLIASIIELTTSEFAITNRRIIIKLGFIRRRSLEILLQKIESIEVNQSVLGRTLNYGSIIIWGVGGSREPFSSIIDPLLFRRKAQEQIDSTKQ